MTKLKIIFFGILLAIFSCDEKPKKIQKSPLHKWLFKPTNLDKKIYRDTFTSNYNKVIRENNIQEAASLLFAFGNALDYRYEYDSNYIVTCKAFLRKYEPQLDDLHQIALNYYIGSQYDFNNENDSSDIYLKKANKETTDKEALKVKGFAGILITNHFTKKGKLEESLQQSLKNLALFESINDTVNIATVYSNMGDVYKRMKLYAESKDCNHKVLELSLIVKDTANIWNSYINLARPGTTEKVNKDSVLYYAKMAKDLHDAWSLKTDYHTSHTYYQYGSALLLNDQLDSVAYYLEESKKRTRINTSTQMDLIHLVSKLDEKLKRPYSNIPEVWEAYNLVKLEKEHSYVQVFANILAKDAFNKRDYKKAYEYHKEEFAIRDSVWNVETRSDIYALEKKYQTVKKEKQIALQKKELSQKNMLLVSLFAISGLLISSILGFYAWQKHKRLKQENINSMNFTKQLLENTEVERKRIATDLHDSVSHELLNLKSVFKQDIGTVNAKIDTIINDIRGISRNLHPVMFDKIGLVPNIEQLVERIQTQNDFLVNIDIEYSGSLSSAEELQIYRIIQEALTNILKYAKAYAAKISLKENDSGVFLEIKDNGKGFNVKETLNSTKAFGLHNIIERSRAIGGEAQIESSGEGTNIQIKIPKKA